MLLLLQQHLPHFLPHGFFFLFTPWADVESVVHGESEGEGEPGDGRKRHVRVHCLATNKNTHTEEEKEKSGIMEEEAKLSLLLVQTKQLPVCILVNMNHVMEAGLWRPLAKLVLSGPSLCLVELLNSFLISFPSSLLVMFPSPFLL